MNDSRSAGGADSVRPFRICTYCVMDTTDPGITFDDRGVCHHCRNARRLLSSGISGLDAAAKQARLNQLVRRIQLDGRGREYDCIIGISGGVDSTYTAYLVKRLGLRPLAVHLDNGWDTRLAVANIERVLRALDIDLSTCVLDWDEFRDLQLSFLRASTPDAEIPTDHAIISLLFLTAAAHGVKYILSGSNTSTESIMPLAWSCGHQDWKYIRSIHGRFGSIPLRTFPHRPLRAMFADHFIHGIRWIPFLDFMDYRKQAAKDLLARELGWEDYAAKHYESFYTYFYQSYLLPVKFGFDKRRAHLSSLICSGQLDRQQALAELERPAYNPANLESDKTFLAGKLGINVDDFNAILAAPPLRFWDYPSYRRSPGFRLMAALANIGGSSR